MLQVLRAYRCPHGCVHSSRENTRHKCENWQPTHIAYFDADIERERWLRGARSRFVEAQVHRLSNGPPLSPSDERLMRLMTRLIDTWTQTN